MAARAPSRLASTLQAFGSASPRAAGAILPISPRRSFTSSTSRRIPSSTATAANTSIDPSEIAHFSRLSAQWWDERGEFGLLHAMNPMRIRFMRDKLNEVAEWEATVRGGGEGGEGAEGKRVRFLEGLEVLDVGCGGGLLSESLSRLGARTTGIDASASNIKIASLHAASDPSFSVRSPFSFLDAPSSSPVEGRRQMDRHSLEYRHTTAEALVEEGERYDVVCAMEVLEHVENPAEFLRSLDRLVKPGGHLFLSTIARTPLSYLLTILAAEHLLRLVEPGTHTHTKYVNPSELVNFFRHELCWIRDGPSPSSFSSATPGVSPSVPPPPPPSPPPLREAGRENPYRMQYETRGCAYLPWKAEWALAPRDAGQWGAEACNYFFWARKPIDGAR